MKLLTKEIEKGLPALYATEEVDTADKVLVAKFFDPCGRGTWYAVERDPASNNCFGYCVSPLGPDCDEWGYFSLTELEGVRTRFGLGIERDTSWRPCKFSEMMAKRS
jgi:hypothetical protein